MNDCCENKNNNINDLRMTCSKDLSFLLVLGIVRCGRNREIEKSRNPTHIKSDGILSDFI